MELTRQQREPRSIAQRTFALLDVRLQLWDNRLVAVGAVGTQRCGDRLDVANRVREVGHRSPSRLQDKTEHVRRRLGVGCLDDGAADVAASYGQQSLALQDPQRLTQRRAADAELLEQLVLLRQQIAVAQL